MIEYIHQQFKPAGQCTENDIQPSEQSNGAVSVDTGVSVSGGTSPVNMERANTATNDEEDQNNIYEYCGSNLHLLLSEAISFDFNNLATEFHICRQFKRKAINMLNDRLGS
ncbi:unnamed protein product, partial [Rhizopus stolonifer]